MTQSGAQSGANDFNDRTGDYGTFLGVIAIIILVVLAVALFSREGSKRRVTNTNTGIYSVFK